MTRLSRTIFCLVIILCLILADQISKWYVVEMYFRPRDFYADGASLDFMTWLLKFPQGQLEFSRKEIMPFFNLVMVWNKGVSFGMFSTDTSYMPYLLMTMALTLTGLFLVWMWRARSFWAALPLALVISGAVSNVWDRARFGAVADFLDFHVAGAHWPSFNIADSCIVIGVAGLALHTLFSEKADRRKTGPNDQAGDQPDDQPIADHL